jgi:hypothetical protein
MIPLYRADPSLELSTTEFCNLVFNTYENGGIFSDHCYEEEGDRLRIACVISSHEGALEIDQERCL